MIRPLLSPDPWQAGAPIASRKKMTTSFEFRIQNEPTVSFPTKVLSGSPPKSNWVPRAKKFITENFDVSPRVPFALGPYRPVPTALNIHRSHLLGACILAGYGRHGSWIGTLFKNSNDCADLRGFLIHRFKLLNTCLDFRGGSVRLKAFHSIVEPSDKNGLSFMLGTMGTYLAARQWLRAADRHIVAFLHTNIFTAALAVSPHALVNLTRSGRKLPDFLVKDSAGEWHVYESKGGVKRQRWSRLVEGLIQLDCISAVGNASVGPPPAPSSKVCVHTVVDSTNPIGIIAVDPPSGPDGPIPDEPPSNPESFSLPLAEGVGELSAIFDSIKWFETVRGPVEKIEVEFGQAKVPVSLRGAPHDIVVGLATPLLERSNLIAVLLAFYQLGRHYFGDEKYEQSAVPFLNYLRDNILEVIEIQEIPREVVDSQFRRVRPYIRRLFARYQNSNLYDVWARALGIPKVVEDCQRWIIPMMRDDSKEAGGIAGGPNADRAMTGLAADRPLPGHAERLRRIKTSTRRCRSTSRRWSCGRNTTNIGELDFHCGTMKAVALRVSPCLHRPPRHLRRLGLLSDVPKRSAGQLQSALCPERTA